MPDREAQRGRGSVILEHSGDPAVCWTLRGHQGDSREGSEERERTIARKH